MRALALSFVIVASPLAATGCSLSHSCTEIGCVNGLTISLKKASTPWEAGMYQVDIDADGTKITCTATLPASASDPKPSSCTDASVQFGVSGSALPASEQSLTDLHFTTAPSRVKVTVTRDGTMIGAKEFTPTYKKSQPNGPDCEPTCNSASDTLDLS